MSDHLAETGMVGRQWCPRCEPDADPLAPVLFERWCGRHEPSRKGLDDDALKGGSPPSGTSEAGGATCRAFGELIHRAVECVEPSLPDISKSEGDAE